MQTLYEAHVVSLGGREGRVHSDDGLLDLTLADPPELGGRGGACNPEQLFAAGFAACFHASLAEVARARQTTLRQVQVTAHVGLGRLPEGGLGLRTTLEVSDPGTDRALLHKLSQEAHKACPYARATRNNIEVILKVV